MNKLRTTVLRNRYTLLVSTLTVYILVVVAEGAITGREIRTIDLDNPFFDLNIQDFEDFRDRRRDDND